MIVRLSAEAVADLEAIGDYIAREDPDRAVDLIFQLRLRCWELDDMAEAFPLVPGFEDRDVRRRVHGRYLIFYQARPKVVMILHILHGARDFPALLFPDE